MTNAPVSPSQPSTNGPQLLEMALQQARELHRYYLIQPDKPYTARVLADCIDAIDRLTERCEAYKGQVKAGAAHIEALAAALREFVAAYKLQDCDNYTEELARAYSIADAALSRDVARAPGEL